MTTPTPTAKEAYAARKSDIARLIDVLQMELDAHAQKAAADERNWAMVGDLGKVRGDLIEMVSFVTGMEQAAIEKFLAE